MSLASRLAMLVPLVAAVPLAVFAQAPTLPSDTLEANFAPRSTPGPTPEVAPTLPSDTLRPGELILPADTLTGEWRRRDEEFRLERLEYRAG